MAERQRQVSLEGFSLYRDDLYINGELAEAASTYASLAGKPRSLSTAWPRVVGEFKPSADRRRDLVKAAALLLAEIERVDRIGLIKRWPVKRDENGMFWHPDLPSFDEGDGDKCKKWLDEQGLVVKISSIEDALDEISERYFDSQNPDCGYWNRIVQIAKAGSAFRFTTLTMARSVGGRDAR
jgi:hypothetical protein